ncbi:peptidase domain-containing ABC transporter [Lutimonas zeaxanthinifaciens]|uniref:peptidase domain-containing ABC transporter n=1 Tax=Lutimonas zeaxanthinifaciens TaxID=3060215 RepID=UPI00265D22AB|nr:peptidase domain-containing ABC transporter [Lutimonas sp. YSD2104]WKK66004.1 peptidase domain-containing ABC transporter [Lutimonas sp. YSD2104]
MKKKIKRVKQQDISDCGAACLVSIAAFYKLYLPIARIRQLIGTSKDGTNILGLVQGAEKIGFDAKGVKGDRNSMFQIPKPAIAHIIVKNKLHHFVVLYKVRKNHVYVMDPGGGTLKKVLLDDFEKQWTGVLVILLPGEKFTAGDERTSKTERFWGLLKPHKFILLQALMGSVFYTLLGFSTSIYIQKITDHVLVSNNYKLLHLMSIYMIFILLVQIILSTYKDIFLLRSGQEIDARLILGYYKHLLKLPQRFFDTMRVGELISRINDAVKIRVFINNTSLSLLVNFFIVLFSFILMFLYKWELGFIMLLIIPVYLLIYWITNRLNKITERNIMEKSADLESQMVESIGSISTIKLFTLEKLMQSKTESRFTKLLSYGYRSSINQVLGHSATQGASGLFTILLLWIGSTFVLRKELSAGEMFSFYAIIGYFTGPAAALISSNKTIQNALIASDRLFEILDLENEYQTNGLSFEIEKIEKITFTDVSFHYDNRGPTLQHVNLCFKAGEITALVGESGSGKSTISKLIQALYPLKNGKIEFNSYNHSDLSIDTMRKTISVVPQNIHLFDGNIIENITIGSNEIDLNKLQKICTDLQIDHFIESLPNRYQTHIGENGLSLSGGQKQLLGIARALYKGTDVLILDEASSSLDSKAESVLQEILHRLKKQNKIIILISHRLFCLTDVDHIIVLEKGIISQKGSHKELITQKGIYQNLWNRQSI